MPLRWDIFCNVVDNYGDIGIAWRLARQLAVEHGLSVRLWVDDLTSFAVLRPEIDPVLAEQILEGVEVRFWPKPFPHTEPADMVIEALACHLPEDGALHELRAYELQRQSDTTDIICGTGGIFVGSKDSKLVGRLSRRGNCTLISSTHAAWIRRCFTGGRSFRVAR